MGRASDAESEYRAAIGIVDQAAQANAGDPDLQLQSLNAHYALGMLLYSARADEVAQDLQQHLPAMEKLAASRPEHMETQLSFSEYYSLLGTVLNRQNRLTEAIGWFRKAAQVREAVVAKNPRNIKVQRSLMLAYAHIGDGLGNPFTGCLGDYAGALVYYEKTAEIAEALRQADPSDKRALFDTAMIRTRIGATRLAAGDLVRSGAELDRAIAMFEPLIASTPTSAAYRRGLAIAYEFRGRNYWLQGDRATAMAVYRKSLALASKLLEAKLGDPTAMLQQIATEGPISTLLALSGDRESAAKMAEKMIGETEQLPTGARRELHLAQSWNWYAQTYEALGDYGRAADAFEKSARIWKSVIGNEPIPPYQARLAEAVQKASECQRKAGRG